VLVAGRPIADAEEAIPVFVSDNKLMATPPNPRAIKGDARPKQGKLGISAE
jgi:hypothetical protein